MKPSERLLMTFIVIAGIVTAFYFWNQAKNHQDIAPPLAPQDSPIPSDSAESKAEYPVDSEQGEKAGAAAAVDSHGIDFTGKTLEGALSDIVGSDKFGALFVPEDLANKFVVTVDNATGATEPSWQLSPLKAPETDFIAAGKPQNTISEENFKRYTPYVEFVKSVDAGTLVALYTHFYPAFQSAYRELGTGKHFNDRLVAVIDHVLKTPEPKGPLLIARPSPHHRYKFVSDELENLSAVQKALIRMGPENMSVIKSKLREIRSLLIHLGKKKT